ncbi:hypothetical protein [Nodosilinea nodulosa]|uniref:hypothetical protein n=1 Tax=Nodosilinea nodulosa TaxID=416001 RepID=UPI0003603F83|nr:hypothetical protein [Nodosilinea nodulosa]
MVHKILVLAMFLLWQPWLALRDRVAPARSPSPAQGVFVKGINFGGGAVVVGGNRWQSYAEALDTGLSTPGAQTATTQKIPRPYASRGTRAMLNSVIFKAQTLDIEQPLPNGSYDIYLWVMENYQSHWHSLNLSVEGKPVAEGIGYLPQGAWRRYGPYPIVVDNGYLRLALTTHSPNVDAHLMGLSIFKPD